MTTAQALYHLGKWTAQWLVVEGSSAVAYKPSHIKCLLDDRPVVLPEERQFKKSRIEQAESLKEQKYGRREFFNGKTFALSGIERAEASDTEESQLILKLRSSDYYNFLATAISLDERLQNEQGEEITVRDKYLSGIDYSKPIPAFASALPINLSLITSDSFIVVSKRGTSGIGGYPGYIAPAINEIISPVLDRDADGNVSVFSTARRGAYNELNVEISEDETLFFTIGVDTYWYFWGLTGLINSSLTKAEIISRRSIGSREQWETKEIYFLPYNPLETARFMRELSGTDRWQPVGIVTLIQSLVSHFGVKDTERALHKYPPLGPHST